MGAQPKAAWSVGVLTIVLLAPGVWSQQQRPGPEGASAQAPTSRPARAEAPGERQDVRDAVASPDLLGGSIRVNVRQTGGGVHLAAADYQGAKGHAVGPWTLPNGKLMLDAVDATASDTALTSDTVNFEASWSDPQGNTYAVHCHQVVPTGLYPVFGGVVTNHILYRASAADTSVLSAEFAYVAFWGIGDVLKNGQIMDRHVAVQGALTEGVGPESDRPAATTGKRFHVIVPPWQCAPGQKVFVAHEVHTGLVLPSGRELPFWHVVFDDPQVRAVRFAAARRTGFTTGTREARGLVPSDPNRGGGAPVVVEMTNTLRYMPRDVTVTSGQEVEWRNTSGLTHTVTCDPALAGHPQDVQLPPGAEPFNSGSIPPGNTFRYTFRGPGQYKYFCIPHEYAGMVGTVLVQGRVP